MVLLLCNLKVVSIFLLVLGPVNILKYRVWIKWNKCIFVYTRNLRSFIGGSAYRICWKLKYVSLRIVVLVVPKTGPLEVFTRTIFSFTLVNSAQFNTKRKACSHWNGQQYILLKPILQIICGKQTLIYWIHIIILLIAFYLLCLL